MTAAEAREAAAWHRARVRSEDWIQRLERDEGAEAAAMFRRSSGYSAAAATALDAFADGQDAAAREREAIRTAIEFMRDSGQNSDDEAYVYGAVLSIIDARGAK